MPVLETPNTRVSNGTPVFEIGHYCPKPEARAHIQTLVSKIRHWCPKFNSSIQNQTLLSESGHKTPKSSSSDHLPIFVILRGFSVKPIEHCYIDMHLFSNCSQTKMNNYDASESPSQILHSFVFISFCCFSTALGELCYLVRVKQWHSMWRKASESLAVVRLGSQVMRLLHLNHLVMWWVEAGMIAYLNQSVRVF